jgi:hypothetical protein
MSDADRVVFVAGLERTVADAYRAALERETLDPATADTLLVLAQHHDEHATALAAVAGQRASSLARDDALYTELDGQLVGSGLVAAAHAIEEAMAATHLESLGVLDSTDAAGAVAAILPVEARHAVVLDPTALPPVQTVDGAYVEPGNS